jgi:hypothetical protein
MASCAACGQGNCWGCQGFRFGHPCTCTHQASRPYWGRSSGGGSARMVYRSPLGRPSGSFLKGVFGALIVGAIKRRQERRFPLR